MYFTGSVSTFFLVRSLFVFKRTGGFTREPFLTILCKIIVNRATYLHLQCTYTKYVAVCHKHVLAMHIGYPLTYF